MTIYQIYTQYLIRYYFALVDNNELEFTRCFNHLVRIERMYYNPEQDNFYHYRRMVKGMFIHDGESWKVRKWM